MGDYFAIVACMHTLLHGKSLKVVSATIDMAKRKGYFRPDDEHFDKCMSSAIWIPTEPLKRYWNHQIWSKFYFELINASKVCEKKDLSGLINMFDDAINSTAGERL